MFFDSFMEGLLSLHDFSQSYLIYDPRNGEHSHNTYHLFCILPSFHMDTTQISVGIYRRNTE